MRLRRNTVPALVISVLLILLGTTAGWMAVHRVLASEPSGGGSPQPTATTVVELSPSPLPNTNSSPTPVPLTEPTPTPVPLTEPTPTPVPLTELTPTPVPLTEPTPTPVPLTEPTPTPTSTHFGPPRLQDKSTRPSNSPWDRSTQTSRSETADPSKGTVYTYEDGDRTVRVVLQDDLVIQETSANLSDDIVVSKRGGDSIVRKQARYGQDARPVFRSESGGGLMTLPGGVLLVLDPEWDQSKVEAFLTRNSISTERVSDLGFLQNGFMVETEPGFASLELANDLASQQGVVVSSPNWWREVEAR